MNFIIFFTIFFSIYTLANYYVFLKLWQFLNPFIPSNIVYIVISIILYLSFILKHSFFRTTSNTFTDSLFIIGSFWLVILLYLFFAFLLLDILNILKIFNIITKVFPETLNITHIKVKQYTFYTIFLVILSIIICSYFNAKNIKYKEISIYTEKKFNLKPFYKIVVISDLHYSILTGKNFLDKMVKKVNNINSDFIILAGDIIDETMLNNKNLSDIPLKNLKATYGIYAITGNHEYIGDFKKSYEYYNNTNIKLLLDDIVKNDDIILIGRNDFFSLRSNFKQRKPLKEIIDNNQIDFSKFIVVADHQPLKIEETIKNNIDLQISGHTHYGQFWPFNLIVKKIYEIPWGYKKIMNTNFYVSSGAGTWGPPVRNMSQSEVVVINIISKN